MTGDVGDEGGRQLSSSSSAVPVKLIGVVRAVFSLSASFFGMTLTRTRSS
jgi:hypothetical protein